MTAGARRKVKASQIEDFWTALLKRDKTFIGRFYYSVRTTGIYCLPSCASRLPRRENVTFHRTAKEAEDAGYRPCRRCHPHVAEQEDPRVIQVEKLCRQLESSERAPRLGELAASIKHSPSHTHRLFKSFMGITPREYRAAWLRQKVAQTLPESRTVTEALYAAGYASPAGFYHSAGKSLGMSPLSYRSGGKGEIIQFQVGECSLGLLLVATAGKGPCAIFLGDEKELLTRELSECFSQATLREGGSAVEELLTIVIRLLDTPAEFETLSLDLRGTAFQQRVWCELRKIPPGTTITYSELAQRLGSASSTRAVAAACARNILALAVPCHRVIRLDGTLAGYRWGLERKRLLLVRERSE